MQENEIKPKKNMQMMLKWKLIEYMDLDEKQAVKFFPKMNDYEKQLRNINQKIKNLKDSLEKHIEKGSITVAHNRQNISEIKLLEQNKIDIREKYLLSLENVLKPHQISKLMIFDKKFKRTLKDQLRKAPNGIKHNQKNKYYKDR